MIHKSTTMLVGRFGTVKAKAMAAAGQGPADSPKNRKKIDHESDSDGEGGKKKRKTKGDGSGSEGGDSHGKDRSSPKIAPGLGGTGGSTRSNSADNQPFKPSKGIYGPKISVHSALGATNQGAKRKQIKHFQENSKQAFSGKLYLTW
jgi:hypothetical protein